MIYDLDPNPAIALYKFWHSLLNIAGDFKQTPDAILGDMDTWGHTSRLNPQIAYGADKYSLRVIGFDENDMPVISYGRHYGNQIDNQFCIDSSGRFRVGVDYGYSNRRAIAQFTFLGLAYARGSYQWWVNLNNRERYPQFYAHKVHRYNQQNHTYDYEWEPGENTPHVADRVVARRWCTVSMEGGLPHIVPADKQFLFGGKVITPERMKVSQEAIEWTYKDDQRLQKRWQRITENRRRRELGLDELPPLKVKVSTGKTKPLSDQTIIEIAAIIDLSAPAQVNRLKEADTNGNSVVPTDEDGAREVAPDQRRGSD